jgi:hypothetical protein
MRNLLAAFAAAGLALIPAACNKSPEGGHPGSGSKNGSSDARPEAKGTFTLSQNALAGGPAMTALKKGETKMIELTVKADKDFKGKVSLKADHPNGMKTKLEPSSVDLTPGSDVKVQLSVTNDGAANADSNVIKVTGTPEHGSATTLDVKVKTE